MNQSYQQLKLQLVDCYNVGQIVDTIHRYIITHKDISVKEQISLIKQMDRINTNYFISVVNREHLHKVINIMDTWAAAWSAISVEYPDVEYFGKKPEIRNMMALVK